MRLNRAQLVRRLAVHTAERENREYPGIGQTPELAAHRFSHASLSELAVQAVVRGLITEAEYEAIKWTPAKEARRNRPKTARKRKPTIAGLSSELRRRLRKAGV